MQDGAELDGVVVRNPLRGDRLPEDLAPLLGFGVSARQGASASSSITTPGYGLW